MTRNVMLNVCCPCLLCSVHHSWCFLTPLHHRRSGLSNHRDHGLRKSGRFMRTKELDVEANPVAISVSGTLSRVAIDAMIATGTGGKMYLASMPTIPREANEMQKSSRIYSKGMVPETPRQYLRRRLTTSPKSRYANEQRTTMTSADIYYCNRTLPQATHNGLLSNILDSFAMYIYTSIFQRHLSDGKGAFRISGSDAGLHRFHRGQVRAHKNRRVSSAATWGTAAIRLRRGRRRARKAAPVNSVDTANASCVITQPPRCRLTCMLLTQTQARSGTSCRRRRNLDVS